MSNGIDIHRKPGLPPKHYLKWCVFGGVMHNIVVYLSLSLLPNATLFLCKLGMSAQCSPGSGCITHPSHLLEGGKG